MAAWRVVSVRVPWKRPGANLPQITSGCKSTRKPWRTSKTTPYFPNVDF